MKKAFTLAEILLVLMIIGILIGLCMGAGRVNLEKAYNLYYYRSYSALCAVFNDFLYQGKHEQYTETSLNSGEFHYVGITNLKSKFIEHLDLLTSRGRGPIEYAVTEADAYFLQVVVKVPALKTKDNTTGFNSYTVLLTTGYDVNGNGPKVSTPLIMISDDGGTGILDSIGMLPTFLDDGETGTYAYNSETNRYDFKPIVPQTLRESFCTKSSDTIEYSPVAIEKSNMGRDMMTLCTSAPTENGPNGNIPYNAEFKDSTIRLLKPAGFRN